MKKILHAFGLAAILLSSSAHAVNENQGAFDPSIYVLMNGNILNFLLLKSMPKLQECSLKTQIAAGLVIAAGSQGVAYAPELAKRFLFKTDDRLDSRGRLLQAIREVSEREALKFEDLYFNDETTLEVSALKHRIEAAAARDQPLASILFYGPPGTGKTELAKSFVHLGFQVFILPSHILRDEDMFREVIYEIERRKNKNKQAIIADDAEFFFGALAPTTTGVKTNSRVELESSFRTELGSDSKDRLWIFTSNKVSDIENDTSGAIKRRLKNKILVPLPEAKTRKAMLTSLIESCNTRFGFDMLTESGFYNAVLMAKILETTNGTSQDQLKQNIDNAIFLAKDRGAPHTLRADDILFFAERSRISDAWMKEQEAREYEQELLILRRQVDIKELRQKLQDQEKNETKQTSK